MPNLVTTVVGLTVNYSMGAWCFAIVSLVPRARRLPMTFAVGVLRPWRRRCGHADSKGYASVLELRREQDEAHAFIWNMGGEV